MSFRPHFIKVGKTAVFIESPGQAEAVHRAVGQRVLEQGEKISHDGEIVEVPKLHGIDRHREKSTRERFGSRGRIVGAKEFVEKAKRAKDKLYG